MIRRGALRMWLALIPLLTMMQATLAFAQVERPQPLTTPIAETSRTPFARFLQSMGMKDPDPLVAATVGFEIGRFWQEKALLLRVEHPNHCSDDTCLTLIGRIVDESFVPDAMFGAGKNVTSSDNFQQVLGFQTLAWYLVGDRLSVTLLETPKGWIVTSQIGGFP